MDLSLVLSLVALAVAVNARVRAWRPSPRAVRKASGAGQSPSPATEETTEP